MDDGWRVGGYGTHTGDVVADRRHLLAVFDTDVGDHHSSHSTYTHSPTDDHHSSHSAHTHSPTTESDSDVHHDSDGSPPAPPPSPHDVHGLGHDEHDSHTLGPGQTRSPTLFPHQLSAEHAQGLAIANVVITILNIVFEAINIGFTGADLLTRPFDALTSFGFAHKNKKLLTTLGASKSGLLILGAQQALHSSITTQLETIGHEVTHHTSLPIPALHTHILSCMSVMLPPHAHHAHAICLHAMT